MCSNLTRFYLMSMRVSPACSARGQLIACGDGFAAIQARRSFVRHLMSSSSKLRLTSSFAHGSTSRFFPSCPRCARRWTASEPVASRSGLVRLPSCLASSALSRPTGSATLRRSSPSYQRTSIRWRSRFLAPSAPPSIRFFGARLGSNTFRPRQCVRGPAGLWGEPRASCCAGSLLGSARPVLKSVAECRPTSISCAKRSTLRAVRRCVSSHMRLVCLRRLSVTPAPRMPWRALASG